MLDIKNINEADQLAVITEEDIAYPEDISYPSKDGIEICLSNLKNLDPYSTDEEKLQFCSMTCAENQNAEICSMFIESDNQII